MEENCKNFSRKNFLHIEHQETKKQHHHVEPILISEYGEDDINKENYRNLLIIGKRKAGKTSTIKHFIENFVSIHGDYCKVVIFSQKKQEYENIITNIDDVYNELFDNLLNSLYESQKNKKEQMLLIIDDSVFINNKLSDSLVNILKNKDDYKIKTIIANQFHLSLKPHVRLNFDTVIVFKDDNTSNIKRMYEHYFGCVPSYSAFNAIISSLERHTAIINSTINCNTFDEKIKFYTTRKMDNNYLKKITLFKLENVEMSKNSEIIEQIKLNNSMIYKLQRENAELLDKIKDTNN